MSGLTVESRRYPTSIASAFGRLFYGASNRVYFSQVFIDDQEVLGKCYQRNDPTSEELNDILATDGGELQISNSGNILAMVEFQLGVLIFAEKGLWYLYGPETGFNATSYVLRKLSDFTVCSNRGHINVGGAVYFAASEGLFVVYINEQAEVQVQNITEETVNQYWVEFAGSCVYPVHDAKKKQLYWFRGTERECLIYDIRFNSFYPQRLALTGSKSEPIVARTADFVKDKVVTSVTKLNLSMSDPFDIKVADFSNTIFEDLGGAFESFITTAPETLGNFSRNKGVPLMSVYFNRTEETFRIEGEEYVFDKPSGCKLNVIWDWATSNAYGKITPEKDIYSPFPKRRSFLATQSPMILNQQFNTGESVIEYRDKVRGTGKSIQFKFTSEPNKDLQLLGYSVSYSAKGRQ